MGGEAVQALCVLAIAGLVLATIPSSGATGASPPEPSDDGPDPRPAAFVPFSPNVRVNQIDFGYAHQVEPTMVVNSQGRIFVGWKEAFTHDGAGQRVGSSQSADGGATWGPGSLRERVAGTRQSDPWLSISGDTVFFTRLEFNNANTVSGITVSNTTDGVTWGTPHFYSDFPMFADKETAAHDAAGNLYWAWNTDDFGSGVQDIVVARSDDGGQTWTPEASAPDPGDGVLGAFVAVHPNGTILLTWWSYFTDDIWFDRSFDGGATWGADVRVNDIPGSAGGWNGTGWVLPLPAMAVAPNGTVYVVWPDFRRGNQDVFFSRSADGGATWSAGVPLNDDVTTASQWMPDLALDPFGGVHVAWIDDRSGAHDVYYVNSTDGGTTWGPNVRVTDVSTTLSFTRPGDYLAVESDRLGNVYAVWTDGRSLADLDIYFARLNRTVTYRVETIPPGLTIEVDGVPRTAPYDIYCVSGDTHAVTAPSPQGTGGTRYSFASWSDGGAPSHALSCDVAGTSTAYFSTEHEITLETSPPGLLLDVDAVAVVAPQVFWWSEGSVHVIATPSPQGDASVRSVFESWSDGGAQTHPITATDPARVTASFRTMFHLAVSSAHGTVACGIADCWYDAGDSGLFSVTPAVVDGAPGTRYVFRGWNGDTTAAGTSGSVTMDAPKTVTALWATEHRLTVTSPYGTTAGAGWHEEGSTAAVSVEAQIVVNGTTYRFAGWIGDAAGPNATLDVAMDGPKSLIAVWEIVPPGSSAGIGFPWWLVLLPAAFLILILFLWRRRRNEEERTEPPPATPPTGPPTA